MLNKMIVKFLTGLTFFALVGTALAEDKITVYAAASLTNALGEISAQYEKEKAVKIVQSYASSSTLAKQIENGAPVDIFISADTKWMDYLQDKKHIDTASRANLVSNKLVLIAPKDRAFSVQFDKTFDFAKAFDGRLCTGEVESVPAGIYAKQSLTSLNWWDGIKSRIVGTQDVRGALAFVERGECAAGIVYVTDALVSGKVAQIGSFPEDSHKPIVYPIALVKNEKNAGKEFLEYLQSPAASTVFSKYGFNVLNK